MHFAPRRDCVSCPKTPQRNRRDSMSSVTARAALACVTMISTFANFAVVRADDARYTAVVTADQVKVRGGPGTSYYATQTLDRGDRVEVMANDADGWCRVRPPQGSFSWVAAADISVRPDGTARVVRDRAKTLVGSRFDDRRDTIQLLLDRDEIVELLPGESGAEKGTAPSWYKITPPAGEYRWIHKRHLQSGSSTTRLNRHAVDGSDANSSDSRDDVVLVSDESEIVERRSLVDARTQALASQPTVQAPLANGSVALSQYLAPGEAGPVMPPNAGPPPPGVAGFPYMATELVPTRHYVSLDALGWWVKHDQLPALVTTSPIGTPQTTAGVLGQPTTSVLFGNQSVNGDIRPGGRVQGGLWLGSFQRVAVEGHYYALATETTIYSASSTFGTGSVTDQILARPYFNDAPGINQEKAVIVAFPDFSVPPLFVDIDGSIEVKESSRLQSAGGGGRFALSPYTSPARFFLLGAYRFFELVETLSIVATSTPGSDPFPFPIPQGRIESVDSFSTTNIFNGGEVGLGAEFGLTRWTLAAESRLAMGNMHETLAIDGRTSAISGGYIASYPGALLAQPTNIGYYTRDQFTLIPQVDVKLGYQVLPPLRLTVGYNFTYISHVLRPGDQVDLTVNTTQIAGLPLVGPTRPQASLNDTSIWLQGITAGLDLRF